MLSAMETAGKENMPEEAERKGLGTPATRAGILEKLVSAGFLERKKSRKTVQLLPSHDAVSLITVLPEQHREDRIWRQTMKYAGMPFGMWALFAGSFQKQLTAVLGYDADAAQAITKKAKPKYKAIIADLPEFEKADRFKMNLVNCAMIGAFILSMPQRPEVDRLTDYYAKAMMTAPMQWFCRKSGKSKFTAKDIAAMKATAALKAADRNPYSWNMEFYEYPDGSGYEGRFTKCGICVMMKELGLYDLTPALCHLDYTMSEAGGVTNFVRQYTLASGGPYCDCGYKKKTNK